MKELLPFTLGLLFGVFGMWMYRYIRRYISRREFEKQRAKFEDSLKEFYKNLMSVDKELREAYQNKTCVPFGGGKVEYVTKKDQSLEEMLQQCLEEENYELAAVIRNKIEAKKNVQ